MTGVTLSVNKMFGFWFKNSASFEACVSTVWAWTGSAFSEISAGRVGKNVKIYEFWKFSKAKGGTFAHPECINLRLKSNKSTD